MRKRHRGRPTRNDADTLQRLALLIRRTPDLPVTSALKLLGLDDISDIRRVRDKHRKFRRIIPGKSAPGMDKVYLIGLFDRMKAGLYPTAKIYFRDDGIAMFGGRAAQTLHIPGRATTTWVKATFVPSVSKFLKRARDHQVIDALDQKVSVEDIAEAFGMPPNRVYQIRKRTKRVA